MGFVSAGTAHLLARAALVGATACVVVTMVAASAQALQIGASGDDSRSQSALSADTTMTEPSPDPRNVDGAVNFYWLGLTLEDGSFIQDGYATNYPGCAGNEWFFWAFAPSGAATIEDAGGCGLTETRTFSLNRRTTEQVLKSTYYCWWAEASGLGLLTQDDYCDPSAPDSGSNEPGAISELSLANGKTPSPDDEMAPIKFDPAIGFSDTGSGAPYTDLAHATLYRSPDATCPEYQVFNDSPPDEFRAGTEYSSPCYPYGHLLW